MRDQQAPGRRTALVTGGTGGIGRAVAVGLAARGHRVVVVGRDEGRARAVLADLDAAAPGAGHRFVRADLSLLSGTADAVAEVQGAVERLDAVVLCAGVLSTVAEPTAEGHERTLVLNYLSRYLMLRLLSPQLTAAPSGRAVLVANAGRYRDTLDVADLQRYRAARGLRVAGRTQFANDVLAVELAERLRTTAVQVTCVFPGVVDTDVFRNARGVPRPLRAVAVALQRRVGAAAEVAAATAVFLADDPAAAALGGGFFGPGRRRLDVPARVRRPERRAQLWDASEAAVAAWLPVRPAPGPAGSR
jgi:NAD(P)-dependent dehydrogenase (short-subunit alcohol dehydrogenase family)